jgi:quercetin dioxygenase-like cupin family protein
MTVVREAEAVVHEVHGSVFRSYVSGDTPGGSELRAWRLVVPAGTEGVRHRPDRDEVLLVLDGQLLTRVNGHRTEAGPGDALLVRAADELEVGAGPGGATCWVTTSAGLSATLADGTVFSPPWAR